MTRAYPFAIAEAKYQPLHRLLDRVFDEALATEIAETIVPMLAPDWPHEADCEQRCPAYSKLSDHCGDLEFRIESLEK